MTDWRRGCIVLWLVATALAVTACGATAVIEPTPTPEPIVPTRTPTAVVPSATAAPDNSDVVDTATETPPAASTTPTTLPASTQDIPTAEPFDPAALDGPQAEALARFGLTGAVDNLEPALAAGLPFGSYLNWKLLPDAPLDAGVEPWQMVRLSEDGVVTEWDDIEAVLESRPGSKWLVGNEPDVRWQDNVTAERYAALYHEVYTFIKDRDPTAQIAAGGIGQVSPLRLAYLDRVLASYEATYGRPLPVDIWSIHTFILREEADSWGVDIPPGMDATTGNLFEIDDHADIQLLQKQVVDFRDWMAENGYQETPLAITEFGVLLPEDFGFSHADVVRFMAESFAYFESAAGVTGYPEDDNRLVQWWFWYSVADDGNYPTGNLMVPGTDRLTVLGQAYRDMVVARLLNSPVQGE